VGSYPAFLDDIDADRDQRTRRVGRGVRGRIGGGFASSDRVVIHGRWAVGPFHRTGVGV